MNKKNLFIKIPKMGELFYDKILYEAEFPVIFTCLDSFNNLYLCQNYYDDGRGFYYIISKTTPKNILEMLMNKITMREAFLNGEKIVNIFEGFDELISLIDRPEDLDYNKSKVLPIKGANFSRDPKKYKEEINYFKNQIFTNDKFDLGIYIRKVMESAQCNFERLKLSTSTKKNFELDQLIIDRFDLNVSAREINNSTQPDIKSFRLNKSDINSFNLNNYKLNSMNLINIQSEDNLMSFKIKICNEDKDCKKLNLVA